ncbi:uncharacterized protein [Dermacentor andersoni]|uniref:uncharacterized protein isoform X1 n=1 Tax=Dermacentor andersoni TaxID=34620 RepID=UPI00241636CF|nr:uncharacterized protein LOC126541476 isoform X1 [Dermacentor andersoni]
MINCNGVTIEVSPSSTLRPPPAAITYQRTSVSLCHASELRTEEPHVQLMEIAARLAQVSLRTLGPTAPDAASLHSTAAAATGPPLVPFFPPRSVLRGGFGRYQGPLSQWQISADMYIDSDIRKRGRRRVVSHSCGEAKAPMAPVERVERRPARPPAEPCPRREDVDREMGLPRRRLVLKGPLHATSYAHWYSRVFSPASSSNEDC